MKSINRRKRVISSVLGAIKIPVPSHCLLSRHIIYASIRFEANWKDTREHQS